MIAYREFLDVKWIVLKLGKFCVKIFLFCIVYVLYETLKCAINEVNTFLKFKQAYEVPSLVTF